ncbi:TPM domain-containing protein [Streptomyces sp. NPDC046203]|uniref:TPM domain-containing protein n=1 Tax=Streptomyces sp. NPDC046203 TaxID=3154602 RepID=UPI0033EC947D
MTRRASVALLSALVTVCWPLVPAASAGPGPHAASTVSTVSTVSTTVPATPPAAPITPVPPVLPIVPVAVPVAAHSSGGDLILPVALVGVVGVVTTYGYTKRRRRTATRTTPGGKGWGAAAGGAGWGTPREPPAAPLDALGHRTRRALVAADDAVRTSQEELESVTARFGAAALEPFAEAVVFARDEVATAFGLRQQLDDDVPEDDATRRALLDEILRRCTAAEARLDTQATAFDRLRDRERTTPGALADAERAFRARTGPVASAQTALATLRARYPASAAAPVCDHVEQAKDRLVFATLTVNQAHQCLDEGDPASAAGYVRAAESAVGQTALLTEAVERRAAELGAAEAELPGALAESEAALAEAGPLLREPPDGGPSADPRGRVRRAAAALAEVRTEVASGRYDPLDALRRVVAAGAALDQAPGTAPRAPALLGPATLTARAALGAADSYVTAHRGAVGAEARTRLAEARRRLDQAGQLAATAPQSALAEAQQAERFAKLAQDLAEQDVRRYGNPAGLGGTADSPAAIGRAGLGGAVLGGIVLPGTVTGDGDGDGSGDSDRTGPVVVAFGGETTRRRLGPLSRS